MKIETLVRAYFAARAEFDAIRYFGGSETRRRGRRMRRIEFGLRKRAMSITDPVVVVPSRGKFGLKQARETFYDEDRCLRVWDTPAEARQWAKEKLGVDIPADEIEPPAAPVIMQPNLL